MTRRSPHPLLHVAANALVLLLVACGPSKSPEATLASAREHIGKHQMAEAVVELKSVLSADTKSGEARLLLGQIFLAQNNAKDAVVELRKAFDIGHNDVVTVPMLARALLESRQGKAAIADLGGIELKDPLAQGNLQATLALAHAKEGDQKRALALVEEAIEKAPKVPWVQLAKARIVGAEGKVDEALALIDAALAAEPKSADGWTLKADVLLFGKKDRAGAEAAYKKLIELEPDNLSAHMSLFGLYAEKSDTAAMKRQHEMLAKVLPAHPQTIFMEAQLAALGKDFGRSKALLDKVMKSLGESPLVLQFAGSVELNLNALAQAEKHLSKALQIQPNLRTTRRLLAVTYLRSNQPGKAIDVLAPNLKSANPDFASISLMAECYLFSGDIRSAELLFQKASKIKPDDARVKTSMSLVQLSRGQVDAAVAELKDTAANSTDTLPDLALISAHLRRKEHDAALRAIVGLEKKTPKAPLPDLLRARVFLTTNRVDDARTSLAQALAKDPAYLPAVAGLASADMLQGKKAEAEKRFADFLEAHPKVTSAQLALAELRAKNGRARADVVTVLDSAIRNGPNEAAPRLALIRYLNSVGDRKAAFSAAQSGASSMPENTELLIALGELQLATGDINQALTTFGKVVAKNPESAFAHLKLGEVHMASNNFAAAEKSATKALELEPKSVVAVRSLAASYRAQGKTDKALAVAAALQKAAPKSPYPYQLEGDIHLGANNVDAAIRAYRNGIDKSGGGLLPEKLYSALAAHKSKDEARRFADDWQRRNPTDPGLHLYLGNTALVEKDLAAAERYFSAAVKVSPANGAALNNLAWVTAQLGKPGAVALAEKAVATNPGALTFQDTLAIALAKEKQFPRAIETAKSILEKAPGEPASRLSLARIYILAGEKKLASEELDALDRLGDSFRGKAELDAMRKQLQ